MDGRSNRRSAKQGRGVRAWESPWVSQPSIRGEGEVFAGGSWGGDSLARESMRTAKRSETAADSAGLTGSPSSERNPSNPHATVQYRGAGSRAAPEGADRAAKSADGNRFPLRLDEQAMEL